MVKIAIVLGIFLLAAVGASICFFTRMKEAPLQETSNEVNTPAATQTPTPNPERDPQLQRQADALLPLFDKMSSVPIFITDAPIKKEGSNTERGVAYTNCVDFNNPSITVKKDFYQKTNRKQLTNILKHELTHAWQCRRGRMWGHDEDFRKKFTDVGGFGN